jgi:hypothetical protein
VTRCDQKVMFGCANIKRDQRGTASERTQKKQPIHTHQLKRRKKKKLVFYEKKMYPKNCYAGPEKCARAKEVQMIEHMYSLPHQEFSKSGGYHMTQIWPTCLGRIKRICMITHTRIKNI